MKRVRRLSLSILGAVAVGGAVLAATVLPGAQAAQRQPASAGGGASGNGIPAAVSTDADLAAHPLGSGFSWSDSIYVAGQVKSGGDDVGILVHTLHVANGAGVVSLAVTDITAGWHKAYQTLVPASQYSWSSTGLDISAPGLTWTGNASTMTVRASTSWGTINATFTASGPALNYAGTGQFQLLGETNEEYALPSLRTTGSLTVNGTTNPMAGQSWLDRQWGNAPLTTSAKWTWMNISLSNGDKIAIWDALNTTSENSWATVLHPDGSYELAAVQPLADSASDPWTSSASGNTYPTRWVVRIPSLRVRLNVAVSGPNDQELASSSGSRDETTANVTGFDDGDLVTGTTYVEMVGGWQ